VVDRPELGEAMLSEVPVADTGLGAKIKKNICALSRTLYIGEKRVDAQAVFDVWPVGEEYDVLTRIKAGPRPTKKSIASFMETNEYKGIMYSIGIEVDMSGLSPLQIAVLTTLSNIADNKTLRQKLALHKVTWATFQAWQKQAVFSEMYVKLVGDSLKQAIPAAEIQLANRMTAGDLNAIKYGFEVLGRHDPANKKQIDAQKMIGLILEVIDRRVIDPDTRAAIGSDLQIISGKAIEM
jgi:hypothetical protein